MDRSPRCLYYQTFKAIINSTVLKLGCLSLSVTSGACIIKLITAVIYGFRNKLECLPLASISRDKHSSLFRKP